MTVELSRLFRFEAAHRLPNLPPEHKCSRLHGHSFEVEVFVAGDVDPRAGWFVDFADITGRVNPLIEALDHRYLNELPGLENPTSEHIAAWLWERLQGDLTGLSAIRVSETPRSKCIYRGGPTSELAVACGASGGHDGRA
jgi:6-pyruvoyltetrahydropterin/6-carboxytetrahydropterin synthase